MKFLAVLLVAVLFPAVLAAAAGLDHETIATALAEEDADIDALVEAYPGWGRRQLLKAKKRPTKRRPIKRKPTKRKPTKRKPTRKPTHKPTRKPTRRPTRRPTRTPTKAPTKAPVPVPTASPIAADQTIDISFTILTRSGYSPRQQDPPMGGLVGMNGSAVITQIRRGGTFGAVADPAETPGDGANNGSTSNIFYTIPGQQEISMNPDYTSILPMGEKIYSFVHFEGPLPSQLYFMELAQNAVTGAMRVVQQAVVDWSRWGGLWLPCAGSVTPWGTHLGSEEYEPDAKPIQAATSLDGPEATSLAKLSSEQYGNMVSFVRYFGIYYPFNIDVARAVFNPYHYGFITELKAVGSGFAYENVKHYTMGRISHEMGDVMPDNRTVYMTDDGTNTALWKYVADVKADLSAGNLYIAQVTQQNTAPGGTGPAATTGFDINWILLGHATQTEIENLVNVDKVVFTDIFDVQKPNTTAPFCAPGFTSINAGQADANHECLRVKPNMEKAAAFLETRRYGAILGGTTEWSKLEGMVLNMERKTLSFSATDVRYGMENNQRQGKDNTRYDIGGRNDIRLTYNQCGCVYEILLEDDFDSKTIRPLVCGTASTAVASNTCDVDGIASPDNLALIPEQQVLIIGEDTSNHQNDMLWAYDYATQNLTRIATSPYGSEYTSVDWYEIGKFGYLMAVVQHPYGESGPISLADISRKQLAFAALPYARTNAEKHSIRVSSSIATS